MPNHHIGPRGNDEKTACRQFIASEMMVGTLMIIPAPQDRRVVAQEPIRQRVSELSNSGADSPKVSRKGSTSFAQNQAMAPIWQW